MKLYLAGPMTGHKDFNFKTFMRYTELLRAKGHDIVNPAEESLMLHGIEWKGSLTIAENEKLASTPWEQYVAHDLEIIRNDVEGVAVLPGWEQSKGASKEVEVCREAGKPVYSAVLLASDDDNSLDLAEIPVEGLDLDTREEGAPTTPDEDLDITVNFVAYEDNPERQRAITGAVKDNRSKSRLDLIPAAPLFGAGQVLAYGARKYKPNNWRLGLSWSDTMASLQRHLLAFYDGEDIDPESGLPHVDHAMCQLLFLSEYYHSGTGEDDRWVNADQEEAKA